MISSVCRVCLASNSQNKIIANTQLQIIFEKLTNKQLISNDGWPESVCYLCHAVLESCCKFVNISRKSEEFLSQIINNGVELTEDILLERAEKNSVKAPCQLSISNVTHVSVYMDGHRDQEYKDVVIKVEPNQKYVVLEPNSEKMKYDNEEYSDEGENSEVHKFDEYNSNHSEMSSDEYKLDNIKPTLEIKEILQVEYEKTDENKLRTSLNNKNRKTHESNLAFNKSKQIPVQEKQLEKINSKNPLYCEYCLKNLNLNNISRDT